MQVLDVDAVLSIVKGARRGIHCIIMDGYHLHSIADGKFERWPVSSAPLRNRKCGNRSALG